MLTGDAYRGHDVRARDRCREPHHHNRCRETLTLEADRAARRDIHPDALAPAVSGVGGMTTVLPVLLHDGGCRAFFVSML